MEGDGNSLVRARSRPAEFYPRRDRRQGRVDHALSKIWKAGYGVATGGVSTSGGFGLGGRATAGAGRTSIAGGKGGACWLTTGPLAAGLLAAGAFTAAGLAAGETAGGRGALTLGLGASGRGGASADG